MTFKKKEEKQEETAGVEAPEQSSDERIRQLESDVKTLKHDVDHLKYIARTSN